MICDICENIFTGSFWRGWEPSEPSRLRHSPWRLHHETFDSMRKSAQSACFICEKLLTYWSSERPLRDNDAKMVDGANGILSWYHIGLEWYEYYQPFVGFRLGEASSRSLYFFVRETNKLSLELSGPKVISDSTNSAATFELIQKWVRNCVDNHDYCNHNSEKNWRPTRLLELDRPSVGCFALNCWSNGTTAIGSDAYVTLSHCWGHGDPLKLTSSTLPLLLKGVLVSELPQTFQDAIVVTRLLGSRFIWIDSLCILQDSHEDWACEAALMGKVYSEALCNVGATASSTGDEGCFRQRNPLLLDRTVIKSSWTDQANDSFHIYPDGVFETPSPLLRRGWVVQEHVLSQRFLHFDAQQVFFECRQSFLSEMYPEGHPIGMPCLTDPLKKEREPHGLIYHNPNTRVQSYDLYKYWLRLVEHYSGCKLTFQSDKLIAISGIAKIIQHAVGDSYFAGLWKDQLPQGLLWRVPIRESQEDVPVLTYASYVAPTWSWASVNAMVELPIMFTADYIQILVDVVQTKVVTASEDPTGEIVSGFIKLRGRLKTVILRGNPAHYYIHFKSIPSEIEYTPSVIYMDGSVEAGNGAKLHFMPIRCWKSRTIGDIEGILLVPIGKAAGQFHRVGVWRNSRVQSKIETGLNALLSAENYDWLEYEDFDGVDKYTITIV